MDTQVWVAAITTGGATLIGWLGWVSGRRDTRQKEIVASEAARREAEALASSRWDAMLDSQREGFEALLAPLREETRDLRGQVGELRDEVTELRREVNQRDGIIATLVSHVRQWRTEWRRHMPDKDEPVAPDTISHLI